MLRIQPRAQLAQRARQSRTDGGGRCFELHGDPPRRLALEVAQDNDFAIRFIQRQHGLRERALRGDALECLVGRGARCRGA